MTQPTETDAKTKRQASLLARGLGLLFLSLCATLVLPSAFDGGAGRLRLLVGWADLVTLVLGFLCIAGYVLAEVLRGGRPT